MMSHAGLPSVLNRNLIQFIPETQANSINRKKIRARTRKLETEHSGQEAKSFYENLISDETCKKSIQVKPHKARLPSSTSKTLSSYCIASTVKTKRKVSINRSAQSSSSVSYISSTESSKPECFSSLPLDPNQRQHFKLLQCAELGDKATVKELLDKGLNVNFTDFYRWTPLMCAAKEGRSSVMKLLLKYGADKSLCNSSGDSAHSIAINAGHSAAALVLESYSTKEEEAVMNVKSEKISSSEAFHCSVCKRDFSQSEADSHQTSTVHLFNSGHKSRGPTYFIPNSNRGFQMLLRGGWDTQQGLGPEGKGCKYPIKTVLKQDRAGLGGEDAKRKKAKITHFGRGDHEAVNCERRNSLRLVSVRKAAQNAAKSKERKERRWEQNLRFEMS